ALAYLCLLRLSRPERLFPTTESAQALQHVRQRVKSWQSRRPLKKAGANSRSWRWAPEESSVDAAILGCRQGGFQPPNWARTRTMAGTIDPAGPCGLPHGNCLSDQRAPAQPKLARVADEAAIAAARSAKRIDFLQGPRSCSISLTARWLRTTQRQ